MRFPATLLLVSLSAFSAVTVGQSVPPGAPMPRSADVPVVLVPRAPIQGPPRQYVDLTELRREASQVLELSKSIQVDFESLSHGLLPEDTIYKLKRIEKLSKHLRNQIGR